MIIGLKTFSGNKNVLCVYKLNDYILIAYTLFLLNFNINLKNNNNNL